MSGKVFAPTLVTSLVLHALLGASIYGGWWGSREAETKPLIISYVSVEEPPSVEVRIPEESEPEKKPEAPDRKPPLSEAKTPEKVSRLKALQMKIARWRESREASETAALEAEMISLRKQKPAIRQSAELLKDPESRKVFSDYFLTVKRLIQQSIRENREGAFRGEGQVLLGFILRRSGALERLWIGEGSRANATAKHFAQTCLKKAAPFPPFPEALDLEKVSFTISVLFQEA